LLTADSRHLGKIENSPYLGRGLTDFNRMWHGDAVRPSRAVGPLKISNLKKSKMAAAAVFGKIAIAPPRFYSFNGRTAQKGRTASPCHIWSKSVKPRPRYGDFSISTARAMLALQALY